MMNEQILELALKLLQPEVRKSAERLDFLLADDFIEIGISGRLWRKADVLQALADERGVHYRLYDFEVKRLGPHMALATYRVVRSADDPEDRNSRRSSVWRQDDGCWRLVFHQGTPVIRASNDSGSAEPDR